MIRYMFASDEQKEIVNGIRKALEKHLVPVISEYDAKGEFPMQVFEKLHELHEGLSCGKVISRC